MDRRRRLFWILLLVLLANAGWNSSPREQQNLDLDIEARLDRAARPLAASAAPAEPESSRESSPGSSTASAKSPEVILVYDAGTLKLNAETEPERVPEPPAPPSPKPVLRTAPKEDADVVEHQAKPEHEVQERAPEPEQAEITPGSDLPQLGTWPTLDASYRDIGFDQYLEMIDRLGGRFFLLVDDGLGPEVSLRDSRVLGPRVESGLAIERPHLVTDAEIERRLKTADLPPGARRTSVVLLFSGWFDRVLWKEFERLLTQHGQTLANISQIRAAYIKSQGSLYLAVAEATIRDDGSTLNLNRVIRLPL